MDCSPLHVCLNHSKSEPRPHSSPWGSLAEGRVGGRDEHGEQWALWSDKVTKNAHSAYACLFLPLGSNIDTFIYEHIKHATISLKGQRIHIPNLLYLLLSTVLWTENGLITTH